MKRILTKTIYFAIIIALSFATLAFLERGKTDPFYNRFTSEAQKALILGNSKAAQGLMPSVLNEELAEVFQNPIYNYSFTVNNSPYGPHYNESVFKKLHPETENSYFILSVDPWVLSSLKEDPNDEQLFKERNDFIANIPDPNMNPNVYYMLNYYNKSYYEILAQNVIEGSKQLHDDGWLEIRYKESKRESAVDGSKKFFANHMERNKFSGLRLQYLKELVQELKKRGEVYLVRLPVGEEILEMEYEFMPNFDELIQNLAKEERVTYFDYSNWYREELVFPDATHMDASSATLFSKELAQSIKNHQKELRGAWRYGMVDVDVQDGIEKLNKD